MQFYTCRIKSNLTFYNCRIKRRPTMFLPLFIAFLVQGLLLGLVVLALLAAAPKLQ